MMLFSIDSFVCICTFAISYSFSSVLHYYEFFFRYFASFSSSICVFHFYFVLFIRFVLSSVCLSLLLLLLLSLMLYRIVHLSWWLCDCAFRLYHAVCFHCLRILLDYISCGDVGFSSRFFRSLSLFLSVLSIRLSISISV